MLVQRIQRHTRVLGAPPGWDPSVDKNGPCMGLPIRDTVLSQTCFMLSAHEPTPEELKALLEGAPLILGVQGINHPVVFLHVGDDLP